MGRRKMRANDRSSGWKSDGCCALSFSRAEHEDHIRLGNPFLYGAAVSWSASFQWHDYRCHKNRSCAAKIRSCWCLRRGWRDQHLIDELQGDWRSLMRRRVFVVSVYAVTSLLSRFNPPVPPTASQSSKCRRGYYLCSRHSHGDPQILCLKGHQLLLIRRSSSALSQLIAARCFEYLRPCVSSAAGKRGVTDFAAGTHVGR